MPATCDFAKTYRPARHARPCAKAANVSLGGQKITARDRGTSPLRGAKLEEGSGKFIRQFVTAPVTKRAVAIGDKKLVVRRSLPSRAT
jgi:hypothetical protein